MAIDADIIRPYNHEAQRLVDQYESKSFKIVHVHALPFIPTKQCTVLDIGAGSGRDAAWFAAHDHDVVAVEPAAEFRRIGRSIHTSDRITWLDDYLPHLDQVSALDRQFYLIWLSAIWMHLESEDRQESLSTLKRLLSPSGRIMISLRHGNPPENRKVLNVSLSELKTQSQSIGLHVIYSQITGDCFRRGGVWWQTAILQHAENE